MKARELEKRLKEAGWQVLTGRGKGSHKIYAHPDRDAIITVPQHKGKDLPTGLLRAIFKQAGLNGRKEA